MATTIKVEYTFTEDMPVDESLVHLGDIIKQMLSRVQMFTAENTLAKVKSYRLDYTDPLLPGHVLVTLTAE